MKRYSVRNLHEDAIGMLAEIKAEERRELGAILEDCISAYWEEVFAPDECEDTAAAESA